MPPPQGFTAAPFLLGYRTTRSLPTALLLTNKGSSTICIRADDLLHVGSKNVLSSESRRLPYLVHRFGSFRTNLPVGQVRLTRPPSIGSKSHRTELHLIDLPLRSSQHPRCRPGLSTSLACRPQHLSAPAEHSNAAAAGTLITGNSPSAHELPSWAGSGYRFAHPGGVSSP
jgi:hypothetical protein